MTEVTIKADGTIDVGTIRNYSIGDISRIESYVVSRADGEVSHQIEFIGGGSVSLRYDDKTGEIGHFRVRDIELTKTEEGDLIFFGNRT